MSKRNIYVDGWHYDIGGGNLSVYVENGYFVRGIWDKGCGNLSTVYPYSWDKKLQCWTIRSGCVKAFYSTVWKYHWT